MNARFEAINLDERICAFLWKGIGLGLCEAALAQADAPERGLERWLPGLHIKLLTEPSLIWSITIVFRILEIFATYISESMFDIMYCFIGTRRP